MVSDDAFYLKSIAEIIGSFLLYLFLVMEQTDTGKCHYHAVLVAGINNLIISYGAAWLCHIFYTAFMCSVNVISKWEEGIRT